MSQSTAKKKRKKNKGQPKKPKQLTSSQKQQAVLGELWERMGRNSAQIVRLSYLTKFLIGKYGDSLPQDEQAEIEFAMMGPIEEIGKKFTESLRAEDAEPEALVNPPDKKPITCGDCAEAPRKVGPDGFDCKPGKTRTFADVDASSCVHFDYHKDTVD